MKIQLGLTLITIWKKVKKNDLYPSVVNVSIGMKIIEQHTTEKSKGGITKYKYNFDGK